MKAGLVACVLGVLAATACVGESSPPPPPLPPSPPLPPGETDGGSTSPSGGAGCNPVARIRPDAVSTTTGVFAGAKDGATWSWKGVPYAAAPVAGLRWKAPVDPTCTPEEKKADAFGPVCPQARQEDGALIGDENCLSLNVWTPEQAAADMPVLVFIHGGGNTTGSASNPIYNGRDLAARTKSVVITMQYRIGALGFFAHADLDAENSAAGVSGNYGILDQVKALEWIKKNAAAFGGASSRVLLFGESGGGQNVLVHVASPLSKGLFAAAAVESGGVYRTTLSEAKEAFKSFVAEAGCATAANVIECLRGLPASKLASFRGAPGPLDKSSYQWGPVVDGGYVLPANAFDAISQGKHNKVPIIVGTNADETSRMVPRVETSAEYETAVRAQYGATLAGQVLTQYPASRFPTPQKALVRLTTDATWTCPIRRLARALVSNQTEPVYRYYFTWTAPGQAGAAIGATHGLELPFVFGTFSEVGSSGGFTPKAADIALSETIGRHWSQLATGLGTEWPRYDAATDPYLELNTPPAAKSQLAKADCDFIDSIVGSK